MNGHHIFCNYAWCDQAEDKCWKCKELRSEEPDWDIVDMVTEAISCGYSSEDPEYTDGIDGTQHGRFRVQAKYALKAVAYYEEKKKAAAEKPE